MWNLVGTACCLLALIIFSMATNYADDDSYSIIESIMPEYVTTEKDSYLCTRVEIPKNKTFNIIGVEPLAEQSQVHHMLLFGCANEASNTVDKVWPCRMAQPCRGQDGVLYGWGRNAPSVHLPEGTGVTVGFHSSTKDIVLQIHYLELRKATDASGIRLKLSSLPVDRAVGVHAFATGFTLPPGEKSITVKNSCCYNGLFPSIAFASRVHTHALGRKVYMDVRSPSSRDSPVRVVDLDPLKPQGFYTLEREFTITAGDVLDMACEFDTSSQETAVRAGHTAKDEMCNLYLMGHSNVPLFAMCAANTIMTKEGFGIGVDVLPRVETALWDPGTAHGQVSGVAYSILEPDSVWLFHRNTRIWDYDTFDRNNKITGSFLEGDVISLVDLQTGQVKRSLGAGMFLMPHMISEAPDGGLWVTDVGLHQVIKLVDGKVKVILGKPQEPGSGPNRFCKPTDVIETRDGRIFVADGYCNNRIVEYSAKTGLFIREFPIPVKESLPHSIAYDECTSVLHIALRQAQTIMKLNTLSGMFSDIRTDQISEFGYPYALRLGMYGMVYALAWDMGSRSHLVEVSPSGISRSWKLTQVDAPHDFALIPSPKIKEEPFESSISVLVAETKPKGSKVVKYVFGPMEMGQETATLHHVPDRSRAKEEDNLASHSTTEGLIRVGQMEPQKSSEYRRSWETTDLASWPTRGQESGSGRGPVRDVAPGHLSQPVFLFAVFLSVLVFWGFMQTFSVSRRLATS